MSTPNQLLADEAARCSKDPLRFVTVAFPWGSGELAGFSGPDEWQRGILVEVRDGLKTIDEALLVAVASGHGIGKSALVAWLILWAVVTLDDTKGVVTANTENQLKTKTWSELAKWYRLCLWKDWFELSATAIYSVDRDHEKTWRVDMVPWSERNTEAFAGLHNQGKRILVVFDEGSAIPDIIWEVTEGALTDTGTQIMWFAFGNPTRSSGRFRECFGKFRHRWITRQIDSRTASNTNKTQLQKWVEDYGEDSDFVKVRVRGIFPSSSAKQFIPSDLVDAARKRTVTERDVSHAATILSLDPAWSGDDEYVIGMRRGLHFVVLWSGVQVEDDVWLAGKLAELEDKHKADAVFIDFGYGTGVKSVGSSWGRNWQLVSFGGKSNDPAMLNKRGEMWNSAKTWLKDGGSIPDDDQVLVDDLNGPEYIVKMDGKICLESKEDMKKRGVPSPNRGDALALTFAFPVMPGQHAGHAGHTNNNHHVDYNPYEGLNT